ncbi:GNAT family N-acetyltransferase [Amycolatopsis sp.]|uniref:GNAT family N-acetyltransferase n=1 Tax=Amycolatopsis sp. TaxID=37632 RepID=UPI002DFAC7D9|nr:GNAT family N-acetyltransferase [Amycolatopsis sp.]
MTEPDATEQVELVRQRYAAAANGISAGRGTGLTSSPKDGDRFGAAHYEPDADLPGRAVAASLGCGNPVEVADLRPGETVLDLGSGGGLDVLLSARRVGPTGTAIGLDMTAEMLGLARGHATEAAATNVEFLAGRIEDIPLPDDSVDVVISNCVIALSVDKAAVFAEIARVLRPGGRIGITDILTDADRAQRAGKVECLAGALTQADYRSLLIAAGFADVEIHPAHTAGDQLLSAIVRAVKPVVRQRDPGFQVVPMATAHGPEVLAIYQAGLDDGDASFETSAPAWGVWNASHLAEHRFVAVDREGCVLGWVAASPVSSRCVYAGVVEHSVYVAPSARGRGVGLALLRALIDSTETAGVWTIQSGVFPENTASLALHERAGFRQIGVRERIGSHHGRWRDVVTIERRSPM